MVHKVMEKSERVAAVPSSLLLGADVGALHDARVEQGSRVCYNVGGRVQLVAHYLSVPEGCNHAYANIGFMDSG